MITPEKLQTLGKSLDSGEASIYVLAFARLRTRDSATTSP